jgi:hypothetical protein
LAAASVVAVASAAASLENEYLENNNNHMKLVKQGQSLFSFKNNLLMASILLVMSSQYVSAEV